MVAIALLHRYAAQPLTIRRHTSWKRALPHLRVRKGDVRQHATKGDGDGVAMRPFEGPSPNQRIVIDEEDGQQKWIAQLPLKRIAAWLFVGFLAHQLKDFFGVILVSYGSSWTVCLARLRWALL